MHVPFCLSKCPYCDFYSVPFSREKSRTYTDAAIRNIKHYGCSFDTVYFGGGTPILLYEHIGEILAAAHITEGAEVTAEANPCMGERHILDALRGAGVTRISFGVQSMNEKELRFLGRRHTVTQAEAAVGNAKAAGFESISADMMIGLPRQDESGITDTASRLSALGVHHISAYILKIEQGTPFAAQRIEIPDDDRTAELYLHTVKTLKSLGYEQYEISNFARPGHECRHNLKYWRCEEYIGIGAAAHSYYRGQRFCVSTDIAGFTASPVQPVSVTDDSAGGWEEYAMLKLRLAEGLTFAEAERFGRKDALLQNVKKIPAPLFNISDSGISLTPEGFVVSNAVIEKLVFD